MKFIRWNSIWFHFIWIVCQRIYRIHGDYLFPNRKKTITEQQKPQRHHLRFVCSVLRHHKNWCIQAKQHTNGFLWFVWIVISCNFIHLNWALNRMGYGCVYECAMRHSLCIITIWKLRRCRPLEMWDASKCMFISHKWNENNNIPIIMMCLALLAHTHTIEMDERVVFVRTCVWVHVPRAHKEWEEKTQHRYHMQF